MEIKIDEWSKSQNVFSKQTDRTDPPPPQAHTKQVNAVFTGSGKSDYSPKIQKDTPPPIIVNNKSEEERPIKTTKKGYHIVKTRDYPFCEYIPKTPYPQRLNVDHSHLNRVVKLAIGLNVAGSISIREDLTTRFLAQFCPLGRTAKLCNDILIFQQHQALSPNLYDHVNLATRRTIYQSTGGKLHDKNTEESWALIEYRALYNNESWNDPRDFAKPVKVISLPQDVSSTSDHCFIKLENEVQLLMEAHLAPNLPVLVNKIASSCEICSGPHDTQYSIENLEQAFVDYASSPHAPIYDAILDKYVESLELGKIDPRSFKILYRVDGGDFYEICDYLRFIVINNPFWKGSLIAQKQQPLTPHKKFSLWEVVMHDIVYPVCIILSYSVWLLEIGDDTMTVVQMVETLCALQTQFLGYNSSCGVANPNELIHLSLKKAYCVARLENINGNIAIGSDRLSHIAVLYVGM
ncbi:hypothetical protein Tco_1057519 [Tanacetum coccineum]|uniref:Uncharacterized protein n=1 Tax=Tanacetum coccineum TaxID=301880 RepID=A0ABQ5H5K9_9ASTR